MWLQFYLETLIIPSNKVEEYIPFKKSVYQIETQPSTITNFYNQERTKKKLEK